MLRCPVQVLLASLPIPAIPTAGTSSSPTVRIVGNRLEPGETRTETYSWNVPDYLEEKHVHLRATLWYRRVAGSPAEILGVEKRPHLFVWQDEKRIRIVTK